MRRTAEIDVELKMRKAIGPPGRGVGDCRALPKPDAYAAAVGGRHKLFHINRLTLVEIKKHPVCYTYELHCIFDHNLVT